MRYPSTTSRLVVIDRWNPKRTGKWKGYQRGLVQKKVRNLAEYLERPDGILPVAGLLNVREKGRLRFRAGKLTIPDDTHLWVVDMQHRLAGIDEAHSKGHLRGFSAPALITEGLNAVKEASQFYVINTRSRRMGVDLTRRLLIEHNEIANLTDVKDWELKAVRIAIEMNKNIRNNNPWYGRIREPESERLTAHIATEKSFVPSLKWLLSAPGIGRKSGRHLALYLARLWEGIRLNISSAFEVPKSYLIQKTPGFMAIHRLAPIIYRRHKKRTVATYRKLFRPLVRDRRFGAECWNRKNRKGMRRYGTGQSAYANIALDLKKKLGL